MLASGYAHGYSGVVSTFLLPLPAAATYKVFGCVLIAVSSAVEYPVEP